jgi:hypothetical protein
VITVTSGTGYTLDTTRPPATGAIENDDYLLDLILDGLPEETAPDPNELSPGAIPPIGGDRTRLELIGESPGYAGTVTLFVNADADAVTLWDSEEDGTQVLPSTWPVGEHPRTLWVETTGVEADIQFIAMFQNKGTIKRDEAKGSTITSAQADITAYRPQHGSGTDAPFEKTRVADEDEESSTHGPGIRINGDDDNKNGHAERRKRTGLSSLAIEAGRVVSRKTGVDRRVVGFSGPQSSVRYKSSLEERVR